MTVRVSVQSQLPASAAPCCDRCAERDARTAALQGALTEEYPAPAYPPRSWFEKPEWLSPGQGLTVRDDGQVAGYFYERGTCILDGSSECWMPPPSPTGYGAFHQQDVVLDDGEVLRVGVIGMVGGHASPHVSASTAAAHYANPDAVRMVVRAGDDEHGAWIAGSLIPGLTHGQVAQVRRSALSGDWRPMHDRWWQQAGVDRRAVVEADGYDCIGPTFVNRPGLPLLRAYRPMSRAASAKPVYLGGLGGVYLADAESGKTQAHDELGRFTSEGAAGEATREMAGGGQEGGQVTLNKDGEPTKVDGIEIARSEPIRALADAKAAYLRDQHLPSVNQEQFDHLTRDPFTTPTVAAAFDDLPRVDDSPECQAAYAAFKQESAAQWDLLTRPVSEGGAGIKVTMQDTDPYPEAGDVGFQRMMNDLRNGEMKVMNVSGPNGSQAHPAMSNEEYTRFRAVHDAFGHAATGRGFDRHSEEAAWVSHASMYGPQADKALATETRGQNTYLGYNHEQGEYKMALLPSEFQQPVIQSRDRGVLTAALGDAYKVSDPQQPPNSADGSTDPQEHVCAVAGHFPAEWKRDSRTAGAYGGTDHEEARMADMPPQFQKAEDGASQKPHAFVDEDGDGKCDVCGKAETEHGKQAAVVQIEVPVPEGMDPEEFAARIAAAIPQAQHVVPPPTVEERIEALEARTAAAEERAAKFEMDAALAKLDAEMASA